MDFSNERYVRLYTRDTTGWKLLRWQGRLVWMELYRKADRSGVVDLAGIEPWEAASELCDLPEEVAQEGMKRCFARGWIVRDGDRLVFPKYLEANETPQSDAQRQRESRAKRAVTKRDEPSQNVTDCHGQSHAVTIGHSDPIRSVPIRSEPEEESAREVPDHWLRQPERSSLLTEFTKRYEQATQTQPIAGQVSKMCSTISKWIAETSRLQKLDESAVTSRLLDGFFENQRAREEGFPPGFLAANPLQYFDAKKTGKGGESQVWKSRVQQSTRKLEELKDRRDKLQRGPNYASQLYDIDKAIREESEALERRKRELHALTG